jgi:hypothetical protein
VGKFEGQSLENEPPYRRRVKGMHDKRRVLRYEEEF